MDLRIANVSQLQQALQSLNTNDQSINSPNLPTDIKEEVYPSDSASTLHNYAPNIKQDHIEDTPNKASSSKARTASTQYSTTQLLYNLAGLQTDSDRKVDSVNDSIVRVHRCLELMLAEQQKQTDLLATIARNTIYTLSSSPIPTVIGSNNRSSKLIVKNYGFTNPTDVVAELLIKVLKEVVGR